MTRLLGVDVGERRIGLALGDDETGAVRPLATIRRRTPEEDAVVVERLAAEHGVRELVVGLPLNLDGTEGRQAIATRAWADEVARRAALPVAWRDERLTSETAEARRGGMARGRSGGPPSRAARAAYRASIDREAAVTIVQRELDARAAVGR